MAANGASLQDPQKQPSSRGAIFCLLTGLLVVSTVYMPGLNGPFRLDDFANLSLIGSLGGIRDFESLILYATSGFADPTGRPVAALSFLLDSTTWPAEPREFKRTNLLIHLINAILLFALLRRWELRLGNNSNGGQWIAALAALLWASHPLWTSSVLYVVQRHAMLPLTFGLLAFHAWERYADALANKRTNAAFVWVLAAGGGLLLAILSKPNGILLAPTMLFIQSALHRKTVSGASRPVLAARTLILWLPTLAFAWLAANSLALGLEQQGIRSWTMAQRLLTEPMILLSYLFRIAFPQATDPSLFEDDWKAATSLIDPWYALPSLATIIAIAAAAWMLRHRWPRFSVAAMTFLICHLMESGPFMLELAFEHRNYLPAIFLTWPLAAMLVRAAVSTPIKAVVCGAVWLALLLPTMLSSQRWGSHDWVSPEIVSHAKASPRTALYWASSLAQFQSVGASKDAVAQAITWHPEDISLATLQIEIDCAMGALEADSASHLTSVLQTRLASDPGAFERLAGFVLAPQTRARCKGLNLKIIGEWMSAKEKNHLLMGFPLHRQAFLRAKGRWQLASNDARGANTISKSADVLVRPSSVFLAVAALGEAGRLTDAIALLDRFPPETIKRLLASRGMSRVHDEILIRTGRVEREHSHLRALLVADLPGSPH